MPSNFDERLVLINALESSPVALRQLLRGVSEEEARRPGQGEDPWSLAQIVSHLIDAANRYLLRSQLMLAEADPDLPFYPDDDYSAQPLSTQLDQLESLRREHVELLRDLSEAQWQRTGRHQHYGPITVESLARRAVFHDTEHLAHISRRLGATRRT